MSRFLALTLVLAVAASAGCGKKPEPYGSGGGASAPPVSAGQSGPSSPAPIDPATVGSISGVVKLDGWLRPDGNVPLGGIPYCASCHPNGVKGDTLVLGEGQTMANVFVHVKNGLGSHTFPVPTEAILLDQVGCIYTPHVRGLRAGQPLLVRNSDNLMHNVKYAPTLNKPDNKGQTTKGAEDTFHFPIPETGIFIKCDIHPWMGAWLHVVAHPYFQVTEKDGAFTLKDLPPGDYEIEAIHERFPGASIVQKVKLEPKGSMKLDFTFKGGTKP